MWLQVPSPSPFNSRGQDRPGGAAYVSLVQAKRCPGKAPQPPSSPPGATAKYACGNLVKPPRRKIIRNSLIPNAKNFAPVCILFRRQVHNRNQQWIRAANRALGIRLPCGQNPTKLGELTPISP